MFLCGAPEAVGRRVRKPIWIFFQLHGHFVAGSPSMGNMCAGASAANATIPSKVHIAGFMQLACMPLSPKHACRLEDMKLREDLWQKHVELFPYFTNLSL